MLQRLSLMFSFSYRWWADFTGGGAKRKPYRCCIVVTIVADIVFHTATHCKPLALLIIAPLKQDNTKCLNVLYYDGIIVFCTFFFFTFLTWLHEV